MRSPQRRLLQMLALVLLPIPASCCASILTEPIVTVLSADSSINISALGTRDWIMPGVTDKAGVNVLSINGSSSGGPTPGLSDSVNFLIGAPIFSFSDGTSPLSSGGTLSHFEHFTSGSFTITTAVQPETQTISLFFGATNAGTATSTRVQAFLSGGVPADDITTGFTSFSAKFMRWDYTFSSTTANSLSFQVTKYADYGTSTGIFAAAVAIPEPSTVWLLLLGTAACLWGMNRSAAALRVVSLKKICSGTARP